MTESKTLADRIEDLLPQTQCTKCGYPHCRAYAEAIAQAAGYREQERAQDVIDFDSTALEPTYTYTDEHNIGHEVWFLDAVTVANSMRLASHYNTRGAALWALGMEDKIPEKANVELVGEYKPSNFSFKGYKKGLKPADYAK